MTIVDSTISGNAGSYAIVDDGTLTIIASTVSGNAAGGINIDTGNTTATVTLASSIVTANTTKGNCSTAGGVFKSAGYNLTDDASGTACGFTTSTDLVNKNPLLGPLHNNGGTTQTMLPGSTSPAADVVPNPTTLASVAVCPGKDQRGVARPGSRRDSL